MIPSFPNCKMINDFIERHAFVFSFFYRRLKSTSKGLKVVTKGLMKLGLLSRFAGRQTLIPMIEASLTGLEHA